MFCKQSSRKSMCNIFGMIAVPFIPLLYCCHCCCCCSFSLLHDILFCGKDQPMCTCTKHNANPPAAEQLKMLKTYNSCSGSKYNCRKMYTHASILFICYFFSRVCVQRNMRWVFVNTKCIIIINETEITSFFFPFHSLARLTVNFNTVKIYLYICSKFYGFLF